MSGAGWMAEILYNDGSERRTSSPSTDCASFRHRRERTKLILKRACACRPSGQWSDENYDVLADGKVVGRILESGSRFEPPELR
jgi:hypothetical protein